MPATRLKEKTLHTGTVAYMHIFGLTGLDFPVLLGPTEPRYEHFMLRRPTAETGGLFALTWQPTEAMQRLAWGVFGGFYLRQCGAWNDPALVWEGIRIIHHRASITPPRWRTAARKTLAAQAHKLSQMYGVQVSPASLAAVAEAYMETGYLFLPNPLTASAAAVSLLLMTGFPWERAAVFGVYYQDPTIYYQEDHLSWSHGLLHGTYYHLIAGFFLQGRWIPVDFMLLTDSYQGEFPNSPYPHVWPPRLGQHPEDGSYLIIDYAHPYTMLFPEADPAKAAEQASPLTEHIPLLQWR